VRPPPGDLQPWTEETASQWHVGFEGDDTGLVLFVFREPRIARVEVGYGLEGALPDTRVRRILEETLVPAFAQGRYEAGFDAFRDAVRNELGGDAAAGRAAMARVERKKSGNIAMLLEAKARAVQVLHGAWHFYLRGAALDRFFVLVVSAILGFIALVGLVAGGSALWGLATLPSRLRAYRAKVAAQPQAADKGLFHELRIIEILLGPPVFALCLLMIAFAVIVVGGDERERKGNYSGAGAEVTWAAALR
jgi:uncharacterized membrane protein YgcG